MVLATPANRAGSYKLPQKYAGDPVQMLSMPRRGGGGGGCLEGEEEEGGGVV